jgi:hypothetical protein
MTQVIVSHKPEGISPSRAALGNPACAPLIEKMIAMSERVADRTSGTLLRGAGCKIINKESVELYPKPESAIKTWE